MTSPAATPAIQPRQRRSLALLLLIASCLFFTALGALPLLEPDEGRNAEVAREMVVTHDYITPHYDGLIYLDKPVVQFWMIAAAFRCFGFSAWAARVPSAVMALACVLLVWLMSRSMEQGSGFRAGIILAVSPLVFAFARTVIFDMTLTFFVSLALYCFWLNEGRKSRSVKLDVTAFAAMGLATLTKGPVGFLIPLLVLAVYHVLAGDFAELRKVRWAAGWATLLAIVLPWFIAISMRNPGFPRYALWDESLLRFTTGAQMHRSQPFYYYIPVYFTGFFPWSLFLAFAGWNRVKIWRSLRKQEYRAYLFLLSWTGVVFVFFSASHSKLPGYFLPAIVPLSVLMGRVWRDADRKEGGRLPDWLTAGFSTMLLSGLLMAASSPLLNLHVIQAQLGRKTPPSVVALLASSLTLGGLIVAALGFLGRNLARRSPKPIARALAFTAAAVAVPLLVLRWRAPLRLYFNSDSSRRLAQSILESPQRSLPVYGYYCFRTGLPFYLRRPVGLVTSDGDEMTSNYIVSQFKQVKRQDPQMAAAGSRRVPLIVGANRLARLAVSSPSPFLLLVRNNEINDALEVAGSMQPLWQTGSYSVWEKKPR